jgi:lipopolysaccharide transport system permease protein
MQIPIVSRLTPYSDLLLVFIWREFAIRYKQSFIGVAWAIFQPVMMMLMFVFVFSYVMPVKISDYPYAIFFYAGILPWGFFSSSLNYAIPSLTNHYNLITKIYFPREILPLAGIAVAVVDSLIAGSVYVVLSMWYHVPVTWNVLWLLPLFLLLFLFTVSVALLLSSLNVYYRDVKIAISFLLQLWFFATPVFYSIDLLPSVIKFLLFLNPMTFIVENIRRCVLEGRSVVWWQIIIMFIFIAGLFFISYRFFIRVEKKFADVI